MSTATASPDPSLPPPPPGVLPSGVPVTSGPPARRVRPGELSPPWRLMLTATWVAAFAAYLAVWKASVELGLGTWWLGARSLPQPIVVRLVPFIVIAVFGSLSSYTVRRLPLIALGGAVVLAVIAVPDLSRSTGLAVVEFAIAGSVAVVAAASATGVYRSTAPAVATVDPATGSAAVASLETPSAVDDGR